MKFVFAEGAGIEPGEKSRIIDIPGGLTAREDLVQLLTEELALPDTADWASLGESLNKAATTRTSRLVLRHVDLPLSNDPRECRNYLYMLSSAGYDHRLLAEFPLAEKAEIIRLLSTHEPEKRERRPYTRIAIDFNCVAYTNGSYHRLRAMFPNTVFDGGGSYTILSFDINVMIDWSSLHDGDIVELFEPSEWFWCEARLSHMGGDNWEALPIEGTFVYPDNVPDDGGPLKLSREYF